MPRPVIDFKKLKGNEKKYKKQLEEVVTICPVNVFDKDKKTIIKAARPEECIGCRACEAQCPDLIKVID